MKALKILVTGASGFVGVHLIRHLAAAPQSQVYGAVYGKGQALKDIIPSPQIIAGDLADFGFTSTLIKNVQPDIIYHLAALSVVHSSEAQAGKVLSDNLVLQYNLLESTRLFAPHCRFLAICSANEYGLVEPSQVPISEEAPLRPLNPYAVSKVAQDMLALQYTLAHDLDVVRLRPFNHTGVGQTTDFVIPALASQFAQIAHGSREPVITVGNTSSIRDFTDVRDMVKAYVMAAEKCTKGEVYNIGYGKGIAVGQIISLLEEISGVKVKVDSTEDKVRRSDVPILIADSSKFRRATGWEPTHTFQETLTWVYNGIKQQAVNRT